jgi:DNA-directed RNA polymerase
LDEVEMSFRGIKRYREAQQKAEEKGRMTSQGAGAVVVSGLVPVFAKAIHAAVDLRKVKKARQYESVLVLRTLPPKVSALIAARTILDSCGIKKMKTNAMAVKIGGRIEDELRFRAYKKQDSRSYRNAQKQVSSSLNYTYQRKVLTGLEKDCETVMDWTKRSYKWKVQVGSKLLELFEDSTGAVTSNHKFRDGNAAHMTYYVSPTQELIEGLADLHDDLSIAHPWFLPMVKEPEPWHGWTGGGYACFDLPLMKNLHQQPRLDDPPQKILDAVNCLQRTGWRVNPTVLATLNALWSYPNTPLPGVPPRQPAPKPVRPGEFGADLKEEDMDEVQKELLHGFKVETARWHEDEVIRSSKLMTASQTRLAAEELKDHTPFFFPYQLDWRGRAYTVPTYLSPQGPDIGRGLIEFSEGKRLFNQEGLDWFLIVGATHFGVDKVGFAARIDWTIDNSERIEAVAADPLTEEWWMEADEPWQFLAWCLEYAEMNNCENVWEFVSHKVCSVDGSANGLQHFSAMIRDEVGAEAVNLTERDEPADLYQAVADGTLTRLERMALDWFEFGAHPDGCVDIADSEGDVHEHVTPEEAFKLLAEHKAEQRWARQWLASGLVTRTLVKQNCMTTPYGSTDRGRREQIATKLRDHVGEGNDLPFDPPNARWAAEALTPLVKEAIDAEVVAASTVMDWMQECARIVANAGLPLRWTTPVGLPVTQKYRHRGKTTVRTQLSGGIRLVGRPFKNTIDRKKQAQGVSPNFVHSLDSSHMVLTVCALTREDDESPMSWSAIHDSFGCHAADAARLNLALRSEFIAMYERDVLLDWKEEIERDTGLALPDPPAHGTFEISQVLDAPFFFG